jgi:uncharacterized membrane protein YdjX (TVP38/TMEM64 family)
MNKLKKLKIYIGIFYLILVSAFLIFLFSHFSYEEITTYKFIQSNNKYFVDLKENNLILVSIGFLLITIIWVLMLGFGSPVGLIAGFVFGKFLGTFLVVLGCTIGATILYIFGSFFLKEFIEEKFSTRFKKLESKFKKKEFNYFLLYRFVGGIPFPISNLVPLLFNIKRKIFFFGTLFGITPALFVVVALGSGVEKIIQQNTKAPKLLELLSSSEIYIPIIGFFCIFIITVILKKFLNK